MKEKHKIKKVSDKKIPFDKTRTYEWLIVAQSYLQCALISARILSRKIGEFGISESSPLGEIYGDYGQSSNYLIFPILFNFKHGIEIYLKFVIGLQNPKFSEGHNLIKIFNETQIQSEKIKGLCKKYAFAKLFLPLNKEIDKNNIFERYPQGSPYDLIDIVSVVDQMKVDELVKDIEFAHESIRDITKKYIHLYEL